jgi:hypothetical protein
MSRLTRVRSVRLRTTGSGTRLRDEIQWPKWLYYPVTWALAGGRWKVSVPVTVLLVAWSGAGLQGVLLLGVSAGACVFGWLRWQRRAEGAAGSGKLNVEDMRHRRTLQKQWGLACRTGKLLGPETGEPPPLRQVRGDGHGTFTATVKCGEIGVPVFAVEKQTAALAEVIGCREVVVNQVRPGVARLAIHWRDPIGRALPLADLPISTSPGHVAYGIRQDGSVATVNATQSILIGGLTRKGKSNLVWALLADLLRQGIYVDLYVSDPKGGVELDQLEAQLDIDGPRLLRVRQYAKTAAETVKMLEAAEKGMHARQYWMKQNGARKIAPDETNPLVVTILDETLPLTDILKKGTDSPLGRVAYTGAAAAYVVWANTQVAQVDAIGRFRDLVPQRICFATPNPQVTDSVLGAGSESLGAYCSDIREPGVGYSHSEGDKVARKFRAAMVTDDETQLIAQGMLPPAVVNKAREAWDRAAEGAQVAGKSRGARRTALYRWFYVDDPEYGNSLGYVGISYDVIHREAQHTAGLRAFMEGNVRRETQWFPSRGEAVAAEALAIATEKPIWNKQHNQGNSRRRIDRFRRDKVA